MQLRRVLFAALALLGSGALADCREASGGRLQGLKSGVAWHARSACRGSTLLWLRGFDGAAGKESASRIDDLLILTDLDDAGTLSLLAPVHVVCRHVRENEADKGSLVFATGNWGARMHANRAWRLNTETRRLEELPLRDVSCVIR